MTWPDVLKMTASAIIGWIVARVLDSRGQGLVEEVRFLEPIQAPEQAEQSESQFPIAHGCDDLLSHPEELLEVVHQLLHLLTDEE